MMLKLQLTTLVAALLSPSAFAASQYYIERAPGSQACTVTETKPTGKKTIAVCGAYKTKAEAKAAMKESPDCGY